MGSAEVASRLHAFRTSGNSDALWPDLPAPARLAALGRIREIVARELAGDDRLPRLEASTSTEVRCVGVAAFTAGMGPLLGHWIEVGRLEAPVAVADLLATHLEHGKRRI